MSDHHHHSETDHIGIAFFLNLSFTVIEIIGGFFTNSMAILSDALHDLGDSFSLGMAWYFQRLSTKKRDARFTYGYRRFSLLGAIINSIVLILGSIYIISKSIPRIVEPEEANATGMFFLAVLGIVVNGIAILRLRKGHSYNAKVVSLHLLEDVLGWTAVLIGSVVIYFTGWYQIDPILSLAIAAFVLFNVYRNIKSTLKVILQATPENINLQEIGITLNAMEQIQSHHDLHVWSLDGLRNIMTVHLVTSSPEEVSELVNLKSQVKKNMQEFGIVHCTIEVETPEERCDVDCDLENPGNRTSQLPENSKFNTKTDP